MQYIFQLLVILGASFLGEICNLLLPLPIPASVYGLVLLFAALMMGIIKLENVEKAATFLIAASVKIIQFIRKYCISSTLTDTFQSFLREQHKAPPCIP